MNISLTPELEDLVQNKVRSGLYHSASEVIREGLRLLKEQDDLKAHRLSELRREIAVGVEQIERGDLTATSSGAALADEIKTEGRKRLARDKAKTHAPS